MYLHVQNSTEKDCVNLEFEQSKLSTGIDIDVS